MQQCSICKREFSFLVENECEYLGQGILAVCNRCSNAMENLRKLLAYLEFIEDIEIRNKYSKMILSLINDNTNSSGERTVGLLEAPAGRKNHHAYSGGLLSHIIQMIEICFTIYHYKIFPFHGVLNKGDIVIGCVIHDLHKAYQTFVKDLRIGYPPFRYAKENNRIPNDFQSIHICSKFGIHLTEYQTNAIIGAEGHFASLYHEIEISKLAALINMADVYSSKILKK